MTDYRIRMEMGPLPKHDSNAHKQELGLAALRSLVASGNSFLLRDERICDYGIDVSLELVATNSSATNFRIAAQLKSWAVESNVDGSYSVTVAPSNLNYLLNAEHACYILYEVKSSKLYFLWADEEFRRLEQEKSDWKSQGSITLRLSIELTPDALVSIHNRALSLAQAYRQLRDLFAKSNGQGTIDVSFHADDRTMIDHAECARQIEINGLDRVNRGQHLKIQEQIASLPARLRSSPSIVLVNCYAMFRQCKYAAVIGELADLVQSGSFSTPFEAGAADEILQTCLYHTGRIDYQEYSRYRERIASMSVAGGGFTRSFEHLRIAAMDGLRTRDNTKLNELCAMVREIETERGDTDPLSLHCRLAYLYVKGVSVRIAIDDWCFIELVRQKMKHSWTQPNVNAFDRGMREFVLWFEEIVATRDRALKAAQTVYVGEAYRLLAHSKASMIQSSRMRQRVVGGELPLDRHLVDEVNEDVDKAKSFFDQADYLEGSLSARITAAEAYNAAGYEEEAHRICKEVLQQAKFYFYANLCSRAEDVLSGRAPWNMPTPDGDRYLSPHQVDRCTDGLLESLQLPKDRRENLRQELESLSILSAYKSQFCRHVELHFELTHAEHPTTAYANPVTAVGYCKRFRFATPEPGGLGTAPIHQLMVQHCLRCTHQSLARRKPKS